ncbi:DUF2029 domain-containing protein [Microlunatus elymi]|uniref:DUF2029 domain-containing protein n=1 Tax=Microlunatus elymi TaxID=2596828 RepID=A0A516PX40_9ACTN|nr:glycosyltransferase 87 family protein [Microlunatus elymi]QDP95739.1 DUF2029 domain-containing protein [Microlunatus elymi]
MAKPMSAVLCWLVSRLLVILLATTATEHRATGDVSYYFASLARLRKVGVGRTMIEYPLPVVWLLQLPYAIGRAVGGGLTTFRLVFVLAMLCLDAAFSILLWRCTGRRWSAAIVFWLGFAVAIGPLIYFRFDLVPSVLAGAALLAMRRRPGLSGVLVAAAAAIKLWPAVLVGSLLRGAGRRRRMLAGFALAGSGLFVTAFLAAGWQRLLSPLRWQAERGLQIESVWATPLMILRLADPLTWRSHFSAFHAFEVSGPGVEVLLRLSSIATVAGILLIILLAVRGLAGRNRADSPSIDRHTAGWLMVASVLIMIISDKVLSPQYLIWLAGPVAALLVIRAAEQRRRGGGIALVCAVLVLALLTQAVFPISYRGLHGSALDGSLSLWATALLAMRNGGLVIVTAVAVRMAWHRGCTHTASTVDGQPDSVPS